MTKEINVQQQFVGSIFGRETTSPALYDIMGYLYDYMINHESEFFGSEDDPLVDISKFMPDLTDAIESVWQAYDLVTLDGIEDEFIQCVEGFIDDGLSFNDLEIVLYGTSEYFESINQNIKNGKYLLSQTAQDNNG